jgi:hypothetical protein
MSFKILQYKTRVVLSISVAPTCEARPTKSGQICALPFVKSQSGCIGKLFGTVISIVILSRGRYVPRCFFRLGGINFRAIYSSLVFQKFEFLNFGRAKNLLGPGPRDAAAANWPAWRGNAAEAGLFYSESRRRRPSAPGGAARQLAASAYPRGWSGRAAFFNAVSEVK